MTRSPSRPRSAKRPGSTRRRDRVISIATPVVILLLWQILSATDTIDSRFYPPPTEVYDAARVALSNGELVDSVTVSLRRVMIGWVLGSATGAILGLLMGLIPAVRAIFKPLIDATYPIPKSALLPLFLLIFGLGEESKWAIIAVSTFYLVATNTMVGVLSIEAIYHDVAKNFGASRWLQLRDIALPGSLPFMFAGLKLAIGVALIILVYAESVAAKSGVGYMIWNSWQAFNVPRMYLGIVTTAALGLALGAIIEAIERVVVPWRR